MKNLNIFSIIAILVLTISLFTSCDKEEFDFEDPDPIEVVTTNPDTVIISDEFVFRVEGGQEQSFNGISVFCPNTDTSKDNFINVIAYGKDLVVSEDGQSAEYEDDLYIFFWETEEEIQSGTYQALVSIQVEAGFDKETIAEITITEVTDAFTYGTFTGKYLDDDAETLVYFSGSFQVSRYECELFGDDLPTPDDFDPELSFGSTTLDLGMGNQEILSSMYLNCTEIFPEVEGNKHLQFLAEAILVDGSDIDEIFSPQYLIYHRETEELELNVEYEGRFGVTDEKYVNVFTANEETLISVTEPITITYTEIDHVFVTGEYYGQYDGNDIKGTFRSQIFECN